MKKKIILISIFILSFLLRIYFFGNNPPSLYWDEASLGYNAYSIATSLKDEHGEFLPLARFMAFGDYKPPGYIYAIVPFIWLGGLNEITTRLPSLQGGMGLVIFTYLVTREILGKKKIALLAAFVMGVSPLGIHFSRAAFEANLAAFYNLVGIYCFLLFRRKKYFLLPSVIFFIFSFYTFNANRIIAPLILFVMSIIYLKEIWSNKKWVLISSIIGLIMILPSLSYLQSKESKFRLQEVSILNNLDLIKTSNQFQNDDNNSIVSKLLDNRRVFYFREFLKHYTDNFDFRFLFAYGDVNPRLAVQSMGQLYFIELPFLILGVYFLIKNRKKESLVLFSWMLIAVIPAGVAKETPHALRIISILPTYQLITAYGLYHFLSWLKITINNKKLIAVFTVFCLMFIGNIFYYLHSYYIHFPVNSSGDWQFGYKEMVQYVLENEDKYDQIYVTSSLGRPYIYFAFYKPFSQKNFSKERIARHDQFGFWDVENLGKIKFDLREINNASGKILVVSNDSSIPSGYQLIKSIKNLKGENVFNLSEKI